MSKRDRFALHARIEQICLTCLTLAIEATFSSKHEKASPLQRLQIEVEVLKRLVRLAYDITVYTKKMYLELEGQLQEISKMATGWHRYATSGGPR